MTLRARPVTRGSGRSGWNSGDRRTTLLNVGFVIAISISVLILVGYAAWSWYDDHFGAAATVDSTTITKDQLRSRAQIESFRITYTENRIRTLANMGIISAANAKSQLDFLDQRKASLESLTLARLIDVTIQARLANEAGIIVTEADIDEEFIVEATFPAGTIATYAPGDADDLAAAILGLVDDPVARDEAIDAAAGLVATMSWERDALDYLAILEGLARDR